ARPILRLQRVARIEQVILGAGATRALGKQRRVACGPLRKTNAQVIRRPDWIADDAAFEGDSREDAARYLHLPDVSAESYRHTPAIGRNARPDVRIRLSNRTEGLAI